MKIATSTVRMLTITDAPNLDPIRIVTENYEPGKGRIIIQCYDRAWCGYWGAMGGGATVEQFFVQCGPDYLLGNLTCSLWGVMRKDAAKREEVYLTRIIEAVQEALRRQMRFELHGVPTSEPSPDWSPQ